MNAVKRQPSLLFLTSYPPRPCGIATFSQDLIRALEYKFGNSYHIKVCALENNNTETFSYPERVKYTLNTDSLSDIINTSQAINNNPDIQLVVFQFEYGLWGGAGIRVLDMVQLLNKPILTVHHTVLPNPSQQQRKIMTCLNKHSHQIIVMTDKSRELLERVYNTAPEKINIIAHGTHTVPWRGQRGLKEKYGYENHLVLSTFGLLGPNKNIETTLKALPLLVQAFPNIKFLILGSTHPELVKKEGEVYREALIELVKKLNISQYVEFVNKYLSLQELLEYLKLTDVYLFSSKDPNQAVSGTFMYAMSCGCPIVSTPIPHAQEMLDDSIGVFFDFENERSLALAIKPLLADKQLRKRMALKAYEKTRRTSWENVAIAYHDVIKTIYKGFDVHYKNPEINLRHLLKMTDNFGIIQFSKMNKPDIQSGYTIDDNARALIAMVMHYQVTGNAQDLQYLQIYLDFIEFCQGENGHFQNYVDQHKKFHKLNQYVNLEDSNGRAIWALGYLLSLENLLPSNMIDQAQKLLEQAAIPLSDITSPRAIALIIKGLYYYYQKYPSSRIFDYISNLADQLVTHFIDTSEKHWNWFENYLTYANSILPEALIYAYDITKKAAYKKIAIASMDFLIQKTFKKDYIKVVSNRGWMHKGKEPEEHGEQPIDVAYTIQSLNAFFQILHDHSYHELMETAFSWFLGNNQLRQSVYDASTGGCQDGLEHDNVNLNQGAESTVCYLIARLTMEKVMQVKPKYEYTA